MGMLVSMTCHYLQFPQNYKVPVGSKLVARTNREIITIVQSIYQEDMYRRK